MHRLTWLIFALGCAPSVPESDKEPVAGGEDGGSADGAGGADGSGSDGGADGAWAEGPSVDEGTESVAGPSTDSEELFDEARLPEFYLTITADARNSLAREPYEYVEAMLEFEGQTYGPIGLRTKGENSWRPFSQKSSLKFDFNRYEGGPDRFYGLKGLTFQAMNEDYSMMHERVAYRIYRELGVPAVRAHHAIIYVNGELYGLFTMLDTVDDLLLERVMADPTGNMWEQHDGEFADDYINLPSTSRPDEGFFHEEGVDDRAKLQALADALEGADPYAAAGEHLSWEGFLRYWAGSALTRNFDAYPSRYAGDDCHVYHDPTLDKLTYLPHGVDETFYYDADFLSMGGLLATTCAADPACRDDFARITYEGVDTVEALDIASWARDIQAQIQPWVEADPNRNYTVREVTFYQLDMMDKIENSRGYVGSVLGPRP